MKQNIIIAVLVLIIGFGIGYLIFGKKTVEPVVIVESKIIENTAKIDSLLCVIGERDLDIEKLKDSLYNAILKELYNIGRDTEWVNNGTYIEEMEKMKQEEIAFQKSLDELENKRLFSDEEYNKVMKKLTRNERPVEAFSTMGK